VSVDIKGLDRGAVLAALYNNSKPQGMGLLCFDPAPMSADEARGVLAQSDWVDYLKGRVIKVKLPEGAESFEEWLYDRDLGKGAAEKAVAALRAA